MSAPLLTLTNHRLDQLFRSSPPGPVPSGDTQGTLLAFPGTVLAQPIAGLVRRIAWQGKVFESSALKNKVTPLGVRAVEARVSVDASWVDQRPCVLIDYSRTGLLPVRLVRDEIRLVAPGEYLGVVWIGRRRVGWFSLSTS